MDFEHAKRLTWDGWFRFFMPYCFTPLSDHKRKFVYLPLNRNYKPLGVLTRDWVEYEAFSDRAMVFYRDPRKITGVWFEPAKSGLYLYGDHPDSRLDYFARLEKLFTYKIETNR